VLGAGAPLGGDEPFTCGAVVGGVLHPLRRGPSRVPSRCPQLPQRQCQNRADRGLQHQPSHLPLLLFPGGRAGLLCRGRLPHTRLHWDRLSAAQLGTTAAAFIQQVAALPAGVMFRHCAAGDQWPDPADPLRIDQALLLQLAKATRHQRAAWSFTHFPMGPENQAAVRLAAAKGLVINASTESRSMAAALVRQGIPAVRVVPAYV